MEDHKAVLEAALFAAGRVLSLQELAEIVSIPRDEVRILADELAREYSQRDGGVEIMVLDYGYVMQVKPKLARLVAPIAPREMEAPMIRTLAIIAYRQPIKQSDLAAIRGNKSYNHVKELERMGLINSAKLGHTKILTTTKLFADYFGLTSERPESVKKAIIDEKSPLGVTPMYESLAVRLDLDFMVVNPYSPTDEDLAKLKQLNTLVIVPGYEQQVRKYFSGRIIEARAKTLSQLKESVEKIGLAGNSGNIEKIVSEIDDLLLHYRDRAKDVRPIKPLTSVAEDIAKDLKIPIHQSGVSVATDCSGLDTEIILPTHQTYEMDIIDRIKQRYDKILDFYKT